MNFLSLFSDLRRTVRATLTVVFGTLICASAFAQQPQKPPPTQIAQPAAPASNATSAAAAAPVIPDGVPSSESGSQYLIGPGDMIQIFVWRSPELTVVVPVRPDGKVSSPLVEDMVALGKTPSQLARDVEKKLSEYIRSPQVSIIVTSAVSTYSQVKVIGQVRMPQALAFREGMTVLDVILAVGGLTDFAAGNRSKIIRKAADGTEQSIKVRVEDVIEKGKLSENKRLQPGDVIIVPESFF